MKKGMFLIAAAAVGLVGLTALPYAKTAFATTFTATVNVDTSTEYPLQQGLLGFNNHSTNTAYSYTDPSYISMAKDLTPRWGRYSAGTANDVFDNKTGLMTQERNAQMFPNRKLYFKYNGERKINEAKGPENLIDYYDFLRQTDSRLTIVVNGFTSTPSEIADLAQFCLDNHIIVDYWELDNEPYLFNGGTSALPKFLNSSTDYLNKVKPFNDAIKAVDPSAKTAIYYSTKGNQTWDTGIKAYGTPFWDAIVWHNYEANDDSETPPTLPDFTKSMENGNYVLPLLRSRIDTNYLANSNVNPIPMVQNELDVRVSGPLYATQYNGVYNAEAVMRLSTAPQAASCWTSG